MEDLYRAYYTSPIGQIEIVGMPAGIVSVGFVDANRRAATKLSPEVDANRRAATKLSPEVDACVDQLDAYFWGRRESFSLRLRPQGTSFQRKVWDALAAIPFGHTATYRDIATRLGKGRAVRAVGHANGRNCIAVIVPCHRVVGSDGALRGHADGLWRKEWLLRHEKSRT